MSDEREPHLTYLDFTSRVGWRLGYGRGPDRGGQDWDDEQTQNVKEVVGDGQRMVYRCVGLPAEFRPHAWTFLRPTRTLTLAEDATELLLPRDCGAQLHGPALLSEDGSQWAELTQTTWGAIRRADAQYPDRTGTPELFAVEPQKTDGTAAQRYKLVFHPAADQEYTVRVCYDVVAEMMTSAQPFHYGGAQHSGLFLAAVNYAAELFVDDQYGGPYKQQYVDELVASVLLDRRARPSYLGVNGDHSDLRWRTRGLPPRFWDQSIVTVNGVTPSGGV